jgi:hypothetical protein
MPLAFSTTTSGRRGAQSVAGAGRTSKVVAAAAESNYFARVGLQSQWGGREVPDGRSDPLRRLARSRNVGDDIRQLNQILSGSITSAADRHHSEAVSVRRRDWSRRIEWRRGLLRERVDKLALRQDAIIHLLEYQAEQRLNHNDQVFRISTLCIARRDSS